MENNLKERKIAIVIWEDVVASDQNWRSEDEGIDWSDNEPGLVNQVGYLLDQDEKYILLMDSFFACSDTIGSLTRIPVSLVRSIKIIEPKDQ
jgi:hypothetical protein